MRVLWSLAVAFVCLSCTGGTSTDSEVALAADCRFTLRRPLEKRLVRWTGTRVASVNAECASQTRCAIGNSLAAVTLVADGNVRIEVQGHTWVRRRQPQGRVGQHGLAGVVLSSSSTAARVDGDKVELFGPGGELQHFPAPFVDEREVLVAATRVGEDRMAVVRRSDDQAGLMHGDRRWLSRAGASTIVPETSPAVTAGGVLFGWLQPGGAEWDLVSYPSGRIHSLVLSTDRERPPLARLRGTTLIEQHQDMMRLDDGENAFVFFRESGDLLMLMREAPIVASLDRGVQRLTPTGIEDIVTAAAGRDLAGDALPAGAKRTRMSGARVDDRSLLLLERVLFPTCRTEDRVYVVDVVTGTVERLAGGDKVRIYPLSLAGSPAWVEGEARYTFVGGAG